MNGGGSKEGIDRRPMPVLLRATDDSQTIEVEKNVVIRRGKVELALGDRLSILCVNDLHPGISLKNAIE